MLRRAEETVLGGKAGSVMREKSAINPVTPAGCHFVAAKCGRVPVKNDRFLENTSAELETRCVNVVKTACISLIRNRLS